MPYKNKEDRNYAREYANYDGTPAVKKKRAERNKARNRLMKRISTLVLPLEQEADHD